MKPRSRWSMITLAAVALIFIHWSPAHAGSSCRNALAQARSAISQLDRMPATAQDLETIPGEQRRQVLSLLPAPSRSAIWQSFFRDYADSHPELTPAQVRVIEDAIKLATPEYFAVPLDGRNRAAKVEIPTRELTDRAQAVFTSEQFDKLFFTMNGLLDAAPAEPVAGAGGVGQCGCNIAYNNCTVSGIKGKCTGNDCVTMGGCGPMGKDRCDGICLLGTTTSDPGTGL